MPWDVQINVTTKVDQSEDEVITVLDSTKLIDDVFETPKEVVERLLKVVDLGVCGRIELTMEEFEYITEYVVDEGPPPADVVVPFVVPETPQNDMANDPNFVQPLSALSPDKPKEESKKDAKRHAPNIQMAPKAKQ